jgi:hypothetical protein
MANTEEAFSGPAERPYRSRVSLDRALDQSSEIFTL